MSQHDEKTHSSTVGLRSIIALGANLPSKTGTPQETLVGALSMLGDAGCSIHARSQWYSSPAWPAGSGPDYVNGAAMISGRDDMPALLALLKRIEGDLGRTEKAGRWDARVCDLDLIAAGDTVLPDPATWRRVAAGPAEAERPGLVLPHPLAHQRAFVMVPVAEIAQGWHHPILGGTFAELRDALPPDDLAALRPLAG